MGSGTLTDRTKLPNRRPAETLEFSRDGINIKMTVGLKPTGEIGEIFLNTNHADSTIDVLMSDMAIIVSIALQHGVSLDEFTHAVKRDKFGIASSPIGAALDRVSVSMEIAT